MWPEIIVGMKFDKIASKLHFKYYYDGFYFDKKQHMSIFKVDINFTVGVHIKFHIKCSGHVMVLLKLIKKLCSFISCSI